MSSSFASTGMELDGRPELFLTVHSPRDGVTVVREDCRIESLLLRNFNSAEKLSSEWTRMAIPAGSLLRPSLGGNTASRLTWRKELHHLASMRVARLVFLIMCCKVRRALMECGCRL